MQGTPQTMQQPVYGPPVPMQPGMMAAPPQMAAPPKVRPSNGLIIGLLTIGAMMLTVGIIVLQARIIIKPPSSGPEYQSWLDLMKYMAFISMLLIDIGAFFIMLIGPYVAVGRQDIPDRVRRALVSLSSTVGVVWLAVMLIFWNTIVAHP